MTGPVRWGTGLRDLAAIILGGLTTTMLYLFGTIGLMLVAYGIPLGATPRPLEAGYYLVHFAWAAVAAGIGGWTTARIARSAGPVPLVLLAAGLAGVALWGFAQPQTTWPGWYAPVLALVGAAGALLGGYRRRREPAEPLAGPGSPR